MIRTKKYLLSALCLLLSINVFAQKEERDYIRKGNKAYKDSSYVDASVNYLKALEVNPNSTISKYNLGNTYLNQQKIEDAMKSYGEAASIEKDKKNLAQIYHNMGVIFQSGKKYAEAVEAYKESLRNNPADNETRYNLALAQKMLKDQQSQSQNQQNQEQQQKEQKQDQQKQDQQQQQQQDQQNQQQQKQQKSDEMSKEAAEQLLKSVMNDEKDTQDKVKKQLQVGKRGRLEKDW